MMRTPTATGYVSVNGIDLYYATYGEGDPLILLHGGLVDSSMWSAVIPGLVPSRQVITVDLQAHGHTADIDRPLSYEAMADDVAALIAELGFEQVDIMGYSLGGGVGLQTAIRHPEIVRRLILISTTFRRDGWYPEVLDGMAAVGAPGAAEAMMQTPLYEMYRAAAPRLEDWPVLLAKTSELLGQEYDWSADVAALQMPVLVVVGDADSVRLDHALELYGLLGGGQHDGGFGGRPASQFAVAPGTLHSDIFFRADLLLPLVTPFLNAPISELAA